MMNSKLLSGGFENRHLNLFSKKIRDEMAQISDISGDDDMIRALQSLPNNSTKQEQEVDEEKDSEDEQMLHQIIHEGRNPNVDLAIKLL